MEKNNRIYKLCFLLVLLGFLVTTTIALFTQHHMLKNNHRELDTLIASDIHDSLNQEFAKLIIFGKAIAADDFLIDYLAHKEESASLHENEEVFRKYLSGLDIKKEYISLLVTSERTRCYYSNFGFNKVIDVEKDPHDVWYSDFKATKDYFNLNVDTDQVVNNTLAVFANCGIKDEEHGLLGAFCLGIRMTTFQEILRQYEDKYQVKISLVRNDGLILVSTNDDEIEKEYLKAPLLNAVNRNDYFYEKDEQGYCYVTKMMKDFGWYLVVQSPDKTITSSFYRIIFVNIAVFLAFAIVLFLTAFIILKRAKLLNRFSYLDDLTGLDNRRSYEEDVFNLKEDTLDDDFVYVNIDVNSLKKVNDTLGHNAGDEIIIGAAKICKELFGPFGKVYRMGGDEFAAMIKIDEETFEDLRIQLVDHVCSCCGQKVKVMSLAIGYAPKREFKDKKFKDLVNIADDRMYEDKAAYYNELGEEKQYNFGQSQTLDENL